MAEMIATANLLRTCKEVQLQLPVPVLTLCGVCSSGSLTIDVVCVPGVDNRFALLPSVDYKLAFDIADILM